MATFSYPQPEWFDEIPDAKFLLVPAAEQMRLLEHSIWAMYRTPGAVQGVDIEELILLLRYITQQFWNEAYVDFLGEDTLLGDEHAGIGTCDEWVIGCINAFEAIAVAVRSGALPIHQQSYKPEDFAKDLEDAAYLNRTLVEP